MSLLFVLGEGLVNDLFHVLKCYQRTQSMDHAKDLKSDNGGEKGQFEHMQLVAHHIHMSRRDKE